MRGSGDPCPSTGECGGDGWPKKGEGGRERGEKTGEGERLAACGGGGGGSGGGLGRWRCRRLPLGGGGGPAQGRKLKEGVDRRKWAVRQVSSQRSLTVREVGKAGQSNT